jgi:polyhydroxyalkanoate synthesis repressor PhaR
MSESVRLIKKYPNRRLYDTKTSAYITLSDVKDLVLSLVEFKVVDAKSGEDLTRSILLQIIIEEESGGVPLFSTDLLSQMIRFYGHAMQGMLGKYLESNIRSFSAFQKKIQDQSVSTSSLYGDSSPQVQSDMWAQFLRFQEPAMQTMMATYMDQSKKMIHQMQDQLKNQTLSMFAGGGFAGGSPDSVKKPDSGEK